MNEIEKLKKDIETIKQHVENSNDPDYINFVMSVLFGDEEE